MKPDRPAQRGLRLLFSLCQRWDCGHGLFARFRIGTRLAAMMVVAALVAALLATLGIQGLATANESLRQVHEDRMKPMRGLAHISHLMLSNRLQLQIALNANAGPLEPGMAYRVADTLQHNMESINQLWSAYQAGNKNPQEEELAQRFAARREQYVREAVQPAISALRALAYRDIRAPASRAHALYERANPELQALMNLQVEAAQATYIAGMQRYLQTWWISVSALLTAMALLSLVGMLLIRSIVQPLRHVIKVFRHIETGKLDTPIDIRGSDEISDVMRALQTMQATLGANQKAIHQLAYYDPLTQLPNRRLLRERIVAALDASSQDDHHRALLLIDLDNFKTINDTQGHEVGDQLLVEVAQLLRNAVQDTGTIARLGGDEFVLLLEPLAAQEPAAVEQVKRTVHKLLVALTKPSLLEGRVHRTSASIGICMFRHNNASPKDLLKRADVAMYQAKANGRNGHCFFNPAMQAHLEMRTALQTALHGAVDAGQFQLHFQAQVDAQGQAIGAEVLLRWTHPQFGNVSPAQFIPIAEESGLILPLGEWVLQQACDQLKRWEGSALTRGLVLGVNVSARQFSHSHFAAQVQSALVHSGANPHQLMLELTESAVLNGIAETVDKMEALRRQGVRFALDDFGTGYSSLSHLKLLPLHQLKIDRSFVQDIVTDPSDTAIVQTIVGMAHNLGLDVIAEGVETEAQRQALAHLDCPSFQGYLFARPMPIQQFEQWLGQHSALAAAAPLSSPTPALRMRA